MSPFDDNWDVTPRRRLDDRTADALLSGREVDGEPELSALIGQLHSLAVGPAPAPSSALAAMLENGLDPAMPAPPMTRPAAVSWRIRSWTLPLQLSLAGSACLALVLGAAAAGELPAPAQTAVADAVEAVTPLHVPRPAAHPAPVVVPTPTVTPEAATHRGGQSPSASPTHPGAADGRNAGRGGDDDSSRTGRDHQGVRPSVGPGGDDHSPAATTGDGHDPSDGSGSDGSDGSGSGGHHTGDDQPHG